MKISADRMRLYAVTDRSWLKGGETLEKAVQAALAGGVTILQLREKHASHGELVAAARRLKEPMSKFPMTIGKYGNTSTASIPLLLDDMVRQDMLKPGDKILLSGFGAGMTWGAVLMEWTLGA